MLLPTAEFCFRLGLTDKVCVVSNIFLDVKQISL